MHALSSTCRRNSAWRFRVCAVASSCVRHVAALRQGRRRGAATRRTCSVAGHAPIDTLARCCGGRAADLRFLRRRVLSPNERLNRRHKIRGGDIFPRRTANFSVVCVFVYRPVVFWCLAPGRRRMLQGVKGKRCLFSMNGFRGGVFCFV